MIRLPSQCPTGVRGNFKAAEGLTLIEVLVVTGIIGVLVSLLLTALTMSKASAGFITAKIVCEKPGKTQTPYDVPYRIKA